MNKNDLKKLIGECIKEMSNDGDEFKVFDTDVDRSMARQKDLAFGTGEIKFKSNTGTDYTVGIDNGDIINVVDKRGNTYDVDEIQTYWEKGFTLIRAISATIGDNDSSQPAQPDEEEKGMLHTPEELQETDKEISKKSKDIPKDVKCKKCGKPVKLGTSSTLCPSCHEKSLDAAEKYYGVQEGDEEGEKSKDTPKDVLDPNVKQVFWKDFKGSTVTDFVKTYGTHMADPKFHAFVTAGLLDGKESDESFTVDPVPILATELKATQNEIGFHNSLDDIIKKMWTGNFEELDIILAGVNIQLAAKGGPVPLIVFDGKYIIDGHHRWSKAICGNPNVTMDCLNFKCQSKLSVESILKAFHLAIAAPDGKFKTEPKEGANLFKSTLEEVEKYVLDKIEPAFLEKYIAKKPELSNKEGVAKYIAENAKHFFGKTGAADGGTLTRSYMPQTDKESTFTATLKSGKLNFLDDSDTVTENMVNETFKKHLGLLYKKLKLK